MFSSGKTRCLLVISFIWGAILVGCGEQESPITEQDTAGSSQQPGSTAGSASDGAATAAESDSASAGVAAKETDASSSTKDPHHSVRQWLTQLVGEEATARDQAREQLKSTDVEDELLLTLMKDSSETVRQGAAYYLTGRFVIQDIALQQAFLEALEDENSKVRQLALQMVARMPVKTIRLGAN